MVRIILFFSELELGVIFDKSFIYFYFLKSMSIRLLMYMFDNCAIEIFSECHLVSSLSSILSVNLFWILVILENYQFSDFGNRF